MSAPLSLGIDIGGTFTDLVIHDPRTGRAVIWKESTTPDDPARGALEGTRRVLEKVRADPDVLNVNLDWDEPSKVVRLQVDQERARALGISSPALSQFLSCSQSGWRIGYDAFVTTVNGSLPQRFTASRDSVRVKVIVDTWAVPSGPQPVDGGVR